MKVDLEDFATGWFGLTVGLTDEDIAVLIDKLEALRQHRGHFHARADFTGAPGIGDIEFYWAEGDSASNLVIE